VLESAQVSDIIVQEQNAGATGSPTKVCSGGLPIQPVELMVPGEIEDGHRPLCEELEGTSPARDVAGEYEQVGVGSLNRPGF